MVRRGSILVRQKCICHCSYAWLTDSQFCRQHMNYPILASDTKSCLNSEWSFDDVKYHCSVWQIEWSANKKRRNLTAMDLQKKFFCAFFLSLLSSFRCSFSWNPVGFFFRKLFLNYLQIPCYTSCCRRHWCFPSAVSHNGRTTFARTGGMHVSNWFSNNLFFGLQNLYAQRFASVFWFFFGSVFNDLVGYHS